MKNKAILAFLRNFKNPSLETLDFTRFSDLKKQMKFLFHLENIQLEVIPIQFETSKKLDKWVENHRKQGCVSHATAGEQFVYEFLPSGIIECQTVKCMCCGEEFTDYVD